MRYIFLICLCNLILIGCDDEIFKKDLLAEDFISFTPNRDSLLANSLDTLLISIDLGDEVKDLTGNSFELSTTEGKFISNGESKLITNGPAVTRLNGIDINPTIFVRLLTTNKPGSHFLKIKREEVFERQFRMNFQRVYPNSISVSKSKASVQNDFSDQIQLIATLKVPRGIPSQGTSVRFVVADSLSSDNSSYFFNSTKSDANGKATVNFTAGAFAGFEGKVKFEAIVEDSLTLQTYTATDSLILFTKN